MDILFGWLTPAFVYKFILEGMLPFAVAMGTFLISLRRIEGLYKKLSWDRVWHFMVKVGLVLGVIYACWIGFKSTGIPASIAKYADDSYAQLAGMNAFQTAVHFIGHYIAVILVFLGHWLPIYQRAFVLVFGIGSYVSIQGLYWRIRFVYIANAFMIVLFMAPVLGFRYFLGYQTPFWDKLVALIFRAKFKENANNAWSYALYGKDDKGEKFQNGQGGSVSTAKIQQAGLAVRRSKCIIRTTGAKREAIFLVKMGRETEADRLVASSALKGFGRRMNASNIRFPEDPREDFEKMEGFVFESEIDYNAGDNLGEWKALFVNPFNTDNRIATGGRGSFSIFVQIIADIVSYVFRISPVAIYRRIAKQADKKFEFDAQVGNKKFIKVQQNLNLDVVPRPENIELIREQAMKVANARKGDVTSALQDNKIIGRLANVLVGGNTAIYTYDLPQGGTLPSSFEQVQTNVGNSLHMTETPIIVRKAGQLVVTVVNGVNIPIDFRDMVENRKKVTKSIISGMLGVDALGENVYFELGDKNPHAMGFGKTGTGKTVTIMTILYSAMSATDPSKLRIMYVDGKGNSFEFMRRDGDTPNPFTWAQPADASGDIEYARGLIKYAEKETRRRISLFKERAVTKLADFNKKFPDEALPEILFVVDEFSAITQQDKNLKASELAEKGTIDTFEYIAKMSRSVGIRLLMANQSARKELVPGKITANVTGRFSLGVAEPIESEIALPDSGIAVHLINQAGEFYSTLENGARNAQHGNSPYLNDDVMKDLNASLIEKFGNLEYGITRAEIMDEDGTGATEVVKPDPLPTSDTELDELLAIIEKFPAWASENRGSVIFERHKSIIDASSNNRMVKAKKIISDALDKASSIAESQKSQATGQHHPSAGELVSAVTTGRDGGTL